jgi:hypothetical protein
MRVVWRPFFIQYNPMYYLGSTHRVPRAHENMGRVWRELDEGDRVCGRTDEVDLLLFTGSQKHVCIHRPCRLARHGAFGRDLLVRGTG